MIKLPAPAMPTPEEVDNAFASPQWNEQYIRQTSLMAARMKASLAFPGSFRSQLLPNLSILFGHGMGIDVLYNDEEFVFPTPPQLHVWLSRVLTAEITNQSPEILVTGAHISLDNSARERVFVVDWVVTEHGTTFNFSYDAEEAYVFERKSELDLVSSFVAHLAGLSRVFRNGFALTLKSGIDTDE